MVEAVTLTAGGVVMSGWTSIALECGIDTVAPAFDLAVTDRWPGQSERSLIAAGAPVVVAVAGTPLITGYVDTLRVDLTGTDHRIEVSGRARAADLIDCSALNSPGSWTNRSLESIAADIAAPFGVTVAAEAPTGAPFARFALQQGESAWEAIERMLRQRALIGFAGADGNVRIVAPKPAAAALTLIEGRHFERISIEHDVADRYSRYVAKGQASGSDQASGSVVAGPRGDATDPGVTRYRPLMIIAEDQSTPASLQARARFEATVRAAKAQRVRVTVPGWTRPDGALWQPLDSVRVVAPSGLVDDVLMLARARFMFDGSGSRVELQFARPEAYSPQPIAGTARASSIEGGNPTVPLGGRQ